MSLQTIEQYIMQSLPGVTRVENYGYSFFLYATEQMLPFATFATADNDYDSLSKLNREGVYRVNIGVSGQTFNSLFAGGNTSWDYTALNTFMPHPDYAAQHFICVLSPQGDNLQQTLNYINEAYTIAKNRFDKKAAIRNDRS